MQSLGLLEHKVIGLHVIMLKVYSAHDLKVVACQTSYGAVESVDKTSLLQLPGPSIYIVVISLVTMYGFCVASDSQALLVS